MAVDTEARAAAEVELALPWHEDLWAHMAGALNGDRVAHGLLFCGPGGVGKRRFAERTVAALLCRERDTQGEACGQCSGCRQRRAGTHPDISRLVPDEPGKRIKVDQVRRFAHALHLTSQYDSGRVGWIDPADALTVSAANSLLKTLEEPPAGCHILLITDRLSSLLPTIRSRCQQWRIPAASLDAARRWLATRDIPVDQTPDDRLRAPLAVIGAHETGLAEQITQWDQDLSRLLARRANPVAVAERAAQAERRPWVDWVYRRSADLLIACVAAEQDSPLDETATAAARRLGPVALQAWSRKVGAVAQNVEANADWRLMLESLFIDLSERVTEAGRT
ncbi:DNA polymerase III subunit delta' [Salinisphaera sp. Q1T1-3]|uniref:DNA polymerase III subunit delta' n=1 Tax=Salinisphaera sp. Q1T1-3 TaxID=2321229 RepID=UPI000E73B095|nr:DNA polymerase III subunit delta' [Salinisphaera sp. Q1T1-3]RJS95097.1 DNA polymerase III subunit delta' [Salinisphaera sp. Q1T1-3]